MWECLDKIRCEGEDFVVNTTKYFVVDCQKDKEEESSLNYDTINVIVNR